MERLDVLGAAGQTIVDQRPMGELFLAQLHPQQSQRLVVPLYLILHLLRLWSLHALLRSSPQRQCNVFGTACARKIGLSTSWHNLHTDMASGKHMDDAGQVLRQGSKAHPKPRLVCHLYLEVLKYGLLMEELL
jgi:hypothetical protein